MSDTESFESVIERVNAEIAEIEAEDRPFPYRLSANVLRNLRDRLKRAHDYEIAQARDPQRLRGTKPDTFDGAIEALREFRWQHATNDEDAIQYINAVKEMHDREIRDVSQREFARGMDAGTHSMDAEHRAVAMRLRHLPLDGGSHENLSQIASAIWHSDWGWTKGACAALRDELVRLMGGVSDGTAEPMTTDEFIKYVEEDTRRLKGDATKAGDGDDTCNSQCRGACAAGDGRDSGKHAEVSDGRIADDSGVDTDCWDGGGDLHMAGVTYDVLDNERHKAVCELKAVCEMRKCDGGYILEWDDIYKIFDALGVDYVGMPMAEVYENLRDRLIHLLGGDQPSGIDVLREMDGESDANGTCPNDDTTSSITEELREWMSTVLTSDDYAWAIADRIDEQFDRICQQQEAVLQSTIDGMVKEYEHDRLPDQLRIEKLQKQRDHWHQQATDMMNHADAMEHERDDLQAKLDEATHDVEMWRDRAEDMRMERDELQAKLDAIRDALDG